MPPSSPLASAIADRLSRLGLGVAIACAATLLALSGFGLLVAALFLWVQAVSGSAVAALVTGLVVGLVAAVLLLTGRRIATDRRASARPAAATGAAPLAMAAALGEDLGGGGKRGAATAIVAALAVGFAIGASPRLRATLWTLLQRR